MNKNIYKILEIGDEKVSLIDAAEEIMKDGEVTILATILNNFSIEELKGNFGDSDKINISNEFLNELYRGYQEKEIIANNLICDIFEIKSTYKNVSVSGLKSSIEYFKNCGSGSIFDYLSDAIDLDIAKENYNHNTVDVNKSVNNFINAIKPAFDLVISDKVSIEIKTDDEFVNFIITSIDGYKFNYSLSKYNIHLLNKNESEFLSAAVKIANGFTYFGLIGKEHSCMDVPALVRSIIRFIDFADFNNVDFNTALANVHDTFKNIDLENANMARSSGMAQIPDIISPYLNIIKKNIGADDVIGKLLDDTLIAVKNKDKDAVTSNTIAGITHIIKSSTIIEDISNLLNMGEVKETTEDDDSNSIEYDDIIGEFDEVIESIDTRPSNDSALNEVKNGMYHAENERFLNNILSVFNRDKHTKRLLKMFLLDWGVNMKGIVLDYNNLRRVINSSLNNCNPSPKSPLYKYIKDIDFNNIDLDQYNIGILVDEWMNSRGHSKRFSSLLEQHQHEELIMWIEGVIRESLGMGYSIAKSEIRKLLSVR